MGLEPGERSALLENKVLKWQLADHGLLMSKSQKCFRSYKMFKVSGTYSAAQNSAL